MIIINNASNQQRQFDSITLIEFNVVISIQNHSISLRSLADVQTAIYYMMNVWNSGNKLVNGLTSWDL